MEPFKFVNRRSELNFLSNASKSLGKERKVIVLTGKSGVGKSRLTQELINRSDKPIVKISIDKSLLTSYDEGYYIQNIAYGIDQYSSITNVIQSFAESQSRLKSFFTDSQLRKSLSEDLGLSVLNRAGEIISGKKPSFSGTVFNSSRREDLSQIETYLQSVFEKSDLILNIENIQNIDSYSLKVLNELMDSSSGSIFLLEYTNDASVSSDVIGKLDHFKPDILNIPSLEKKHLQELIENHGDLVLEIVNRSFSSWEGNLIPLREIFYAMKNEVSITSKYDLTNSTRLRLESLHRSEKLLLFIIASHVSVVDQFQLKELYELNDEMIFDVETIIYTLKEYELIKIRDEQISIKHDSIQDELLNLKEKNTMPLLAHNFWLKYYNKLWELGSFYYSRHIVLLKLLYFSASLNLQAKIISLLETIKTEAILSASPKKMIDYVVNIKNDLANHGESVQLDNIRFWLIELYQNLSVGKEALSIIQEIKTPSNNVKVLHFILLELTGQQREGIKLLDEEIGLNRSNNIRYELVLRLIRLQSKNDIGEIQFCNKEFHLLYNDNRFQHEFEYGFLLRNAELIFNANECLPYFLKSIQHFEGFKATKQAALSRVAYSIHLALTGDFNNSKIQLDLASNHLLGNIAEHHTVLNNHGVLFAYEAELEAAASAFKQALRSAELDFDKIAISSNLLATYDLLKQDHLIPSLVKVILRIMENPGFSAQRILWYCDFNLYKYYSRIHDTENANMHLDKLNASEVKGSDFWKVWINAEELSKSHNDYYRYKLERPFSYLTHWNIDFDSTLMNYE